MPVRLGRGPRRCRRFTEEPLEPAVLGGSHDRQALRRRREGEQRGDHEPAGGEPVRARPLFDRLDEALDARLRITVARRVAKRTR